MEISTFQNKHLSALISTGIHAKLLIAYSARYVKNNIESIPILKVHIFFKALHRVLHRAAYEGSLQLSCKKSLTIESLSLLYFLFISWFISFRRRCKDKIGVFHANQTAMCLDPHLNHGWGWRCGTGLSPPKNIFTDRSKAVLLLWIICVIYVLCLSCFCVCSLLPCGHWLGSSWPLGSVCNV